MIFYKILLGIIPILFISIFIYKRDIEKEPISRILKVFFGAIGLTIVITLIELLVFGKLIDEIKISNAFLYYLIVVALLEETLKYIPAKFIGAKSKDCNSYYDVIIYSTISALGFACIENILYVSNYNVTIAYTRMLLSVPGHILYGMIMGAFIGLAIVNKNKGNKKYKLYTILSILIPTILHGFYDYFIAEEYNLIAGIYISILYLIGTYIIYIIVKAGKNNSYELEENFFKIDSFSNILPPLRFISMIMILLGCIYPILPLFKLVDIIDGILIVFLQLLSGILWKFKKKKISVIFSLISVVIFMFSLGIIKYHPSYVFYIMISGFIFQIIVDIFYKKSSD